ncbi:MAG: diguanylate cyclase [Pseudomonadota bacterium]
MTELELALLGAAGLAVVLLLVLVLWARSARRAARHADERVAAAVAELDARTEATVRELGDALARAEADSRRHRLLSELTGSIDLDDVLERTLDAAVRAASADAALAGLAEGIDGRPLVVTSGLSAEEAQRHATVVGPPDGRVASSVSIAYRYDTDAVDGDGADALIHLGLAVPLTLEGRPFGQLAVFARNAGRPFSEDAVRELEELAQRAAPAIENARRFREARHQADLDSLTGLHNRRFFHETLQREVARAQRYDRELALVVLDLDDFKAINDRIGHLAGDAALASAAERLHGAVRSADIGCRVGGDEFAIILPESSLADADQLYRRVQDALAAAPAGPAGKLSMSAGIAQLQRGDDASSLFERADDALYRAKESGKAQVIAATS